MKILITGDTFTIKSGITKRDYDAVPVETYVLKSEEGSPIFAVAYEAEHAGEISPYGIIFNGVAADDCLLVTRPIPADVEDKKDYVAARVATMKSNLHAVEKQIEEVVGSLRRQKEDIKATIEVL